LTSVEGLSLLADSPLRLTLVCDFARTLQTLLLRLSSKQERAARHSSWPGIKGVKRIRFVAFSTSPQGVSIDSCPAGAGSQKGFTSTVRGQSKSGCRPETSINV